MRGVLRLPLRELIFVRTLSRGNFYAILPLEVVMSRCLLWSWRGQLNLWRRGCAPKRIFCHPRRIFSSKSIPNKGSFSDFLHPFREI